MFIFVSYEDDSSFAWEIRYMIRISDKSLCTGCTACMNICPAQCIVMRRDREGFDYPVANPDRCTDCGKCEQLCPVLNPREPLHPLEAVAVRNDEHVGESSSGGVFLSLAAAVIKEGGVVYGAVVNEDMSIGHTDVSDISSVERMLDSKYVQSDLYGTFDEVKYCLSEGRKVLFAATPCQIAGLKSYLGDVHEGLLTIDCSCRGVSSPGLWEKYVKALEKEYGARMKGVRFRDRSRGLMNHDFVLVFEATRPDGTSYIFESHKPCTSDIYMTIFLQNMSLRPSCYNCPARQGRSGSDLTSADLWDTPEFNDDKGSALLLVNTERGREAISAADLSVKPLDLEDAVRNNGGLVEPILMPEGRAEFFKGHHSAKDLSKYMKSYYRHTPLYLIIYKGIGSVLSSLKRKLLK